MQAQKFPKALVQISIALDLVILLIFLFMPRSGMEAMGAAFLLYPLAAVRLILAVVCMVLAWRRRRWLAALYTVLAMVVLSWFWFVGASMSPTYDPLHRVLRTEYLLAAGADPNQKDGNGAGAIHSISS